MGNMVLSIVRSPRPTSLVEESPGFVLWPPHSTHDFLNTAAV